jgi:hypothetical protein
MHHIIRELYVLITCGVVCSPRLPFKLGYQGSIDGRISTQGLKKIEEKMLPFKMDNLHVRLNSNLSKEKGIKHHS